MEVHESVEYVPATAELKARIQCDWASNAGDWICLGDDCCSIVAMSEGRPIGLISAQRRPLAEPVSMLSEAWISIIEVHEDYRRQGIGTALVSAVIDWARENSIDQVGAWSESVRTEALLLWQQTGFSFAKIDLREGYGFYVTRRVDCQPMDA